MTLIEEKAAAARRRIAEAVTLMQEVQASVEAGEPDAVLEAQVAHAGMLMVQARTYLAEWSEAMGREWVRLEIARAAQEVRS